MDTRYAAIGAFVVALAGIVAATVVVCLGKIDAQSYVAILSGVLFAGVGAGAHASGVNAGSSASGNQPGA